MTEQEFLSNGHIREYYDVRELEEPVRTTLNRIKHRIRQCEKEHIDYEVYVDKDCLKIVLEQLDCCIRNKDNPNIKKVKE